MRRSQLSVILCLGTAQTLAWASSYYLLAILADPIASDIGASTTLVFAAFSGALLISALIGPRAGRTIDRIGGRLVLVSSNLFFALGLGLLAASASWPPVCLAWALIGIGMGLGLYDAAFAVSTAMAAHLPRLLQLEGASEAQAVLAGMLIGPAQVAARVIEAWILKRSHPLLSARFSAALHPIGVGALYLGTGAIPAFSLLHGAGNGILTIARGTLPLAIYGPVNYGYRLGILGAPARIGQAAAPLLFGVLIERIRLGRVFVFRYIGARYSHRFLRG